MLRAVLLLLAAMGAWASVALAEPVQLDSVLQRVPSQLLAKQFACPHPIKALDLTYAGPISCSKLAELTDSPSRLAYTLKLTLQRSSLSSGVEAKLDVFAALVSLLNGGGVGGALGGAASNQLSSDTVVVEVAVPAGGKSSGTFGGELLVPVEKGLSTVPYGLAVEVVEHGKYSPSADVTVTVSAAQRLGSDIVTTRAAASLRVGTGVSSLQLSLGNRQALQQIGTSAQFTDRGGASWLVVSAQLL